MLIYLDKIPFMIGAIDEVVNFLFAKSKKTISSKSKIILPCSLNDLALKENVKYKKSYQKIDYCTNDSMLITNYLKHRYKIKIERIYGPDLMQKTLEHCSKNNLPFRHYFLAPNQKTMVELESVIKKKYKKIHSIFNFLPDRINQAKELSFLKEIPLKKIDVLWIGIGSPKQIELASYIKSKSKGITIVCVGAAFDFISGCKKQAPLWIRKHGLEWLFRLLSEPQRLWRRYLIIIPKYLSVLICKKITKSL